MFRYFSRNEMESFMKVASLLMGMLMASGTLAFAGPSVSGGGGSGSLQISGGYTSGKFDVSALSSNSGDLRPVLDLFRAAGAQARPGQVIQQETIYLIPGAEREVVFFQRNSPMSPNQALQVNFKIAYADLIAVNSGIGAKVQETSVDFRGLLANILYEGFVRLGAKPVGATRGGNQYAAPSLFCSIDDYMGKHCRMFFRTLLTDR
jgi:hypothetical protein